MYYGVSFVFPRRCRCGIFELFSNRRLITEVVVIVCSGSSRFRLRGVVLLLVSFCMGC